MSRIIITGSGGQTASHLIDFLSKDENNIIIPFSRYCRYDLIYPEDVDKLIKGDHPDFILNFAALSSTTECEKKHVYDLIQTNTIIVANFLESIKKYAPHCRFLNAGSEQELSLNNKYALSKSLAYKLIIFYRKSYNLFAIQPLLYTHTGPRQKPSFFMPKLIKGALKIKDDIINNRRIEPLTFGNLNVLSSWAFAGDIAEMCWRNLNLDKPVDLYLSGHEVYSGRQLICKVFDYLNIWYSWDTVGCYYKDGQSLINIDKSLFRSGDENRICPENSLKFAHNVLDWKPKHDIMDVIKIMVEDYEKRK